MTDFTPYLNFMGNSGKAMNFYKAVLGGTFTIYQRFKDVPGGEKMSPEDQEKFMHISLTTGNGHTLMATDALESMGQKLVFGNNFHICIQTDSEAEADKFFNGLSEDGKIEMPMNKTFWGAYFGMCEDKFGVRWMVSYTYATQQD